MQDYAVNFISDDKTLLGNVSSDKKRFSKWRVWCLYYITIKRSTWSVLDSNMDVKEGEAALVFSDKGTSVNYMLADLSVIPVVPELKALPPFTSTITHEMMILSSKFIKSKGALSDSDTFTFDL